MNLSTIIEIPANETDPCIIKNFGAYFVYIIVFISFVSIFECLGVIFVICFTKKLHKNSNIYVASLAANDFLLTLGFIANQLSLVSLHMPSFMRTKLIKCFILGLVTGTVIMSIGHLGVIAVDRYIQIAHPFYYMEAMTKTRTFFILLGVWITCLIFIVTAPTALYDDKYHKQSILLHTPKEYNIFGLSVYAVSLILIFICYLKIGCVAFKHKQSANARRLNVSEAETIVRDNLKAALRSVKFFALMFGVVFICTFTSTVMSNLGFMSKLPDNIYVGMFSIVPIYSAINFLIYAYMNKEFSPAFASYCLAVKQFAAEKQETDRWR